MGLEFHHMTHPVRKRLYYDGNTPHPYLPDGTYAIIGPFTDHIADPELQRDIETAVARYNHRHGFMLFGKAPV
jgi:hypothetical protein